MSVDIDADFKIDFRRESSRLLGGASVKPDSVAKSAIYTVLSLAAMIEFDEPIPLLETTNIYRWLRSGIKRITVVEGAQLSYGNRDAIKIRIEGSKHWTKPNLGLRDPRILGWSDSRGFGIDDLLLLIVHEAYHAIADVPHDRNPYDSSLEYGGVWAAQYWTNLWLARHTGTLTKGERAIHERKAQWILDNMIKP